MERTQYEIDYLSLMKTNKDSTLDVEMELRRAVDLHGLQKGISLERQYLIYSEESLEIAKGILENNLENIEEEITQTIAMLVKLLWLVRRKNE